MGQSRYERLPKTQNWQSVISLLASPQTSVANIALETARACQSVLRRHSTDPVLISAIYLIVRLPLAARKGNATEFLRNTGVETEALASPISLSDALVSFLQQQNFENPDPSFVGEISLLTFQETFSKLIAESNLDLFADAPGQTENALASYGTARGFATAARLFFTSFMHRALSYFLSKETVNAVGLNERFESLDSLQQFMGDLRRYCWESSKIIDSFAEEWYSKYKWQEKLDDPHVATFVWAAIKKFSAEIGREHQSV